MNQTENQLPETETVDNPITDETAGEAPLPAEEDIVADETPKKVPGKQKKKKKKLDKEKIARGKALYKEHRKQKKQERKINPWIVLLILVFVLAAGGVGGYFGYDYYKKDQAIKKAAYNALEASVQTEALILAVDDREKHIKDAVGTGAGEALADGFVKASTITLEGILNRPPYVELTQDNTADFTNIESCLIGSDGLVNVNITAKELPISDDGYYYLFAEDMFETNIEGKEPVTKGEKDIDFTMSCNLNLNSASSRLYQKFVVAVLLHGKYVEVSSPKYITNPEAAASHAPSFYGYSSKKGLLVDPSRMGSELDDLGVKHAAYNIMLSRILGGTSNSYYPTIGYSYNGRSYAFNGHVIAEYDQVFGTLTNKGIEITAIILNDQSAYGNALIHPLSRGGGGRSSYYAFNNTNDEGIDAMAAVATFLAERYSGIGHGKVMNWVISNEVNVRMDWNYISSMDVDSYSRIYADSIRVFYNGIKSKNKNARVYISLDQQWNRNRSTTESYDGKDMIDCINSYIKSEGNIDWCLAIHPYNYPLTAGKAWTAGRYDSLVTNSVDTSIVTMKNINIVTTYMSQENLLTDDGQVRRVILSEVGYSSSNGQEIQAASFAYAYKKIENNPYIDSILLNRQTDHPVEVAQGLALGVVTSGGGHKSIYNVFKYIDTASSDDVTKFARDMIGISSWSQIQ